MLQRVSQPPTVHIDEQLPAPAEPRHLDFNELFSAARRQFRVLLIAGAACLALGIAFILTEVARFTASTDMLIEYRQITFLEDSYLPNPLAAFDGILSSEMEVIRSEAVARHVIDSLQLIDDPRFQLPAVSPTKSVISFLRESLSAPSIKEETEEGKMHAAVERLRSNLRVARVGPAFVLRIEYTAQDPSLAADVANAVAEGYLRDQRERKHETMSQASEWLLERVTRLREELADAELAVSRARRTASDETALVALHALEREADTYRSLHASTLQQYQESLHQQSMPTADARIINLADPPSWTSYPPKLLILAISLFMGGAIGVGLGAFSEYRDHGFRRGGQVRDLLHLDFLGMLPRLRGWRWALPRRRRNAPEVPTAPVRPTKRAVGYLRHVLDSPSSSFSECLRSIYLAANLKLPERKLKVIGVTSVLRGEGRSIVAKNLATLLAARGCDTLLIDGDLTNPCLSNALAPAAKLTLADVVLHGCDLREAVLIESESRLSFLPSPKSSHFPRTSDLVASSGFAKLLLEAANSFDYVIIDLPPMAEGLDVSATAARIDAFTCVIEWARTPRELVQKAFAVDQNVQEKCLGVIYNKVDTKQLRRYESFRSDRHFKQIQRTGFRV